MKYYLLVLFSVLLFTTCDIINPDEDIPAYIYIDQFELTTSISEGSNSHKITDAWIFVGSEFVGVFELPARVPVLASGEQNLLIQAGIKENGIGLTPIVYPYYEWFESTINLTPGQIDTIRPTTTYRDNVFFAYVEDFEGSHFITDDMDGDSETAIVPVTDGGFEGRAGRIFLDQDHPTIQVGTSRFSDLPISEANPVFMELDYKTEVVMQFGLRGYDAVGIGASAYDPGVNVKTEWNKIYINFSQLLALSQLEEYQFLFAAGLPIENGNFTLDNAEIFIDNVKILYREQ